MSRMSWFKDEDEGEIARSRHQAQQDGGVNSAGDPTDPPPPEPDPGPMT